MYQVKKQIRKQMIKGIATVAIIFVFAAIFIHGIYDKFKAQTREKIETEVMEVSFYNKNRKEINFERMLPVTDAVGLSNAPYDFVVKNKTEEKIEYQIVLEENEEKITTCGCSNSISFQDMKVNIQKDSQNLGTFSLAEFENLELFHSTLASFEEAHYQLRFWIRKDAKAEEKHFHFVLRVVK